MVECLNGPSNGDYISFLHTNQVGGKIYNLKMSMFKLLLVGTLAVLISISLQQTVPSFNVNMDIDIESGDYMVNSISTYKFSVFTNRVDAGTRITIKVSYMLTVIGSSGNPIFFC
jgi:hypothetical protein